MNDTINIISTKPITKEEFYSTELQARQHVPFNASWVAFEIPKAPQDTLEKYFEACILVRVPDSERTINAFGYIISINKVQYLVAIKGLSYNELYYLYVNRKTQEVPYVVPPTSAVGSFEKLHRRKYISTPAVSYWNAEQIPVIITK